MPIMAIISGPHSKSDYDALRNMVKWETDHAKGGLMHVAAFDDKGMHVTDIWETEADLQSFVADRLGPAMEKLKLAPPEMAVYPVHATFSLPGYRKFDR